MINLDHNFVREQKKIYFCVLITFNKLIEDEILFGSHENSSTNSTIVFVQSKSAIKSKIDVTGVPIYSSILI